MMKQLLLGAALAAAMASTARAAISVDGVLDAGYGAAMSHVFYDPAAPLGNFGAPTDKNHAIDYDIYLSSDANNIYGMLIAGPNGVSAGPFANLYWDINPSTGSDIGFELSAGAQNVFRPGGANLGDAPDMLVALSGDLKSLEFSIPNHYFLTPPAGLLLAPGIVPAPGATIRLNLSQTFGYSVAGGQAFYGDNRLGTVVLGGAVPEPATWAMMIIGLGAAGSMIRRRRAVTA